MAKPFPEGIDTWTYPCHGADNNAVLDAVTGKVLWLNDSSGTISDRVQSGVSLQGNLGILADELRFCGGTVSPTARYDLWTGQCLNEPSDQIRSQRPTAFSAYYPRYGQFTSLWHRLTDGNLLSDQGSPQGDRHTRLALLRPKSAPSPGAEPARRQRAETGQAASLSADTNLTFCQATT